MNKILLVTVCCFLFCGFKSFGQANIFDPNDVVITYNSSAPPATPPDGQIAKWVRSIHTDWNTDKFKAYYYNGMAFRLRYPNNYNVNDNTKKYPMILFLHGGGESAGIYDNEYQLFLEAQKYQTMMDNGQWNGFLLFPLCQEGSLWEYSHFERLNVVLDNLTANRHLDPDRVVITGLSMGGFGSLRYGSYFPRYPAMLIGNSPALVQTMSEEMRNNIVQIPMWIANGGVDVNPEYSIVEDFINNMRPRGASIRHSLFMDVGHGVWDYVYDNPDIIGYYNTAHKANPVIYNGKNQYPANATISSKLGLTPGFAEYQWQRNNVDIAGANSYEYTATQFGSYRARFRRTSGGPWSDWSLVPANIFTQDVITGPGDVNGLAYKYYEGIWSSLPNFSALGPSKTGVTPNIDVTVRNRDNNFAFIWEGKIKIPTTGKYIFELTSDDGSKLYFNSYYGPNVEPLINNDGLHGAFPIMGAVQNLTAGASIPMALTYFQSTSDQGVKLFWTGPGIPRQEVPNSAFTGSGVPADVTPPSAPANLQSPSKGANNISLSWTASTDNVGVTRYDIFENGTSKYTTTGTSFNVTALSPNTSYTYTVKAFDAAGNGSALSNSLAVTTSQASTTGGLNYRYYEGDWNVLPNFSALTPLKTGTVSDISVGMRNVDDYYGVVFEGYINLPTAGNYTFELGSDDGSKFYFNSFYNFGATALVNNDGAHGETPTVSASTGNVGAGAYPMALAYFEKWGGEAIKLYWTGPGISRQLVPASAYSTNSPVPDTQAPTVPTGLAAGSISNTSISLSWTASTDNVSVARYDIYENGVLKYTSTSPNFLVNSLTPNTTYTYSVRAVDQAGNVSAQTATISPKTTGTSGSTSGLNYKYYEGDWDVLPNFSTRTPLKTGTVSDISVGMRNVDDYYGLVFEGYINLPTAGNYTFELASDDGSKFYFNSFYNFGATALVNNDGAHGETPTVSASTGNVGAGAYPMALAYFEKWGGEAIRLYWTGPGIPRQLVPASAYTTNSPVPDTQAPTVPTGLAAGSISNTSISLSWTASTDNVSVARYDIYENGVLKYTSTSPNFLVNSLAPNTLYTYAVRAADPAGNVSAQSATISPKTTGTSGSTSGLNYKYYEGDWNVLPNYSALTPLKTGTVSDISVGMRNVDDYYGIVFEGYINLPTAGNYTFELASDDGSKFYFNSFYNFGATALVNNDGAHGETPTVSASTGNVGAGAYPMALAYFEKWGGEAIKLYWTGPGITRQLVPASAFTTNSPVPDTQAPTVPTGLASGTIGNTFINLAWTASTDNVSVVRYDIYENGVLKYTSTSPAYLVNGLTPNTTYTYSVRAADQAGNVSAQTATISPKTTGGSGVVSGLNYKYYEGDWDVLPNFSTRTPLKTGTVPNISVAMRNVDDYYGLVFEGYINLPTAGNYTFELASDDGSKFYFNSFYNFSATALVNNDGAHGETPTVSASTGNVSAGAYPMALAYFEKWGGEVIQLYWTGPGIPRQLVPASAFSAPSAPPALASLMTFDRATGMLLNDQSEMSTAGKLKITEAYPNPFVDRFTIEYRNDKSSQVDVQIYDLNGRLVMSKYFGALPVGTTFLKLDINGKQAPKGIYLARVNVDGVPAKLVKLLRNNK